jgi:catechol 2,3-dioxygenase-like lactoylglutathione lyase family enzyme
MALGRVIPALPVADTEAAAAAYRDRLGFTTTYRDDGLAIVVRDIAEIHLWRAGDASWRDRGPAEAPVRSGAESFLAGTASCRIAVDGPGDLDALHVEITASGVVHPVSVSGPSDTPYGLRELHALDLDGNLITFFHAI